jgi:hypothetical protein
MSVQQKWILSGLIGGLLLLLFPPFLYGPSGATGRQWHFFLDSRRTFYSTPESMAERGQEGKVDVVFLLLELTILGVGALRRVLHYRLWGYNAVGEKPALGPRNSGTMSLPVQVTFHPHRKQASREFQCPSPINAAAERVLRGTFTS